MSNIDIAMTIYVFFMLVFTFPSIKYGATMIKKTGLFFPQTLIAATIHLILSVVGIIGWSVFAWKANEFLFVAGLFSGLGLFVIGEIVLFTVFLVKRKQWIQSYQEENKRA